MVQSVDIYLGDEKVGRGEIKKEGLYYLIDCHCFFSEKAMYRLTLECEEKVQNLGICIPERNEFVLHKKIPVKSIGSGHMCIRATPKESIENTFFVPISPDEPFKYIHLIKNAVMDIQDGKVGLLLKNMDQRSSSNPTGQ